MAPELKMENFTRPYRRALIRVSKGAKLHRKHRARLRELLKEGVLK